jgi:ribonuclease HII
MTNIYEYEAQAYLEGYKNIVGTDEVGRGPMAGPLVAAAVILPQGLEIAGLNDSKKLSAKKREELYKVIKEKAIEVQVTFIDVDTVDRINVFEASKMAMIKSIQKMNTKVDYILTDAMKLGLDIPTLALIKGDAKSASIAAASIIAKVERDNYMVMLDEKYPNYGFKRHKGYVTKEHLQAIQQFGITDIHRKTFAPVSAVINQNH